MWEIKYYSVNTNGKKWVRSSTRPFVIRDGETANQARVRLGGIIDNDSQNLVELGQTVIFVTVRYCSESTAVTFAEVLYTDSFNL